MFSSSRFQIRNPKSTTVQRGFVSKVFSGLLLPLFLFVAATAIAQAQNQPPVAKCKNITVSADSTCMAGITPANVDDGSADPDAGDTITLTLDSSGPFTLGAHTVTLTATDSAGLTSSCTATVTVVDTTDPVISDALVNPTMLWPPNHKMVPVTVSYTLSDNCDSDPISVLSVTSDEGTSDDWEIIDAHHVNLRTSVESVGVVGVDLDGGIEIGEGGASLAAFPEEQAAAVEGELVIGIAAQGSVEIGQRFVALTPALLQPGRKPAAEQ